MLSSRVVTDDITREISSMMDYEFDGVTHFTPPKLTAPEDFSIGLIVGPSGSGKSTILSDMGGVESVEWDSGRAIASHFPTANEAAKKMSAAGLNSVPDWLKPYHHLSTGQKFRADLARQIKSGALVDEFTSVVDRTVAKSCSVALSRYVKSEGLKGVVLATCHYDVLDWLCPDWVFDTATGLLSRRGSERRPEINLEVLPSSPKAWGLFSEHHYLDANINSGSLCWIAEWEGKPVGFTSALAMPSGSLENAWRGHRTVILPEYQGMGFGVRLSDSVGEMMLQIGRRFFSKTAHPRMGEYRNRSPLWKPTSKNGVMRPDYLIGNDKKFSAEHKQAHAGRVCYSHEYIGKC